MARDRRASRFRLGGEEFLVVTVPTPRLPGSLSPTEREIVSAVLAGGSDADIATRRGISARTVANHLRNVFRKLHVQSRSELVAKLSQPTLS